MEIGPPGALTADALPSSRTIADENGQFAMTVPATLDGLELRLESGSGSIVIEQGNVMQ
jgi:hypothetical protein